MLMFKKITAILLAIVILLVPLTVSASKIDEYEEKQEQAEEELEEVQGNKSALMKEIQSLSDSIADNEDKLSEINAQLVSLNREIKQLEEDIKEKEEQYNTQEEALKQKIEMDYEMGKTTYLDVLLNSKGILDFISNYYLISEIIQKDDELLTNIEEQKRSIEENKEDLQDKQKEVKTQKAKQEKTKVLLENQKTQKQSKVSSLSQEEKDLQAKIDEYDELIKEEERKASQIASGSSGAYVGGNKVWPCTGSTRITSGYGGRNTGIPGASTNHKGIDIGCPTGTPIVSVLDGKVIFTGYNRYRGYYIMVDHGGGVVTLYQHCKANSFKVSVGDKVKAGQTIILSGATGIGSGPHLHFEVLINGSNVNPQTWLKQS